MAVVVFSSYATATRITNVSVTTAAANYHLFSVPHKLSKEMYVQNLN